jgi:hypothetical protein
MHCEHIHWKSISLQVAVEASLILGRGQQHGFPCRRARGLVGGLGSLVGVNQLLQLGGSLADLVLVVFVEAV